ncbi:OstA family protein [Stanieria sp. NIES-3757]|nr:OstA family protein [Stanieria sp. NIES-3757]
MISLLISLNYLAVAQPVVETQTQLTPILHKVPKTYQGKINNQDRNRTVITQLNHNQFQGRNRLRFSPNCQKEFCLPTSYLITQERNGEIREFTIPDNNPNSTEPTTPTPVEQVDVIEVIADRQEYNNQQQVVTAEGKVVMNFAQAVLTADRLQVNLADRIAVAQGNVVLTRGQQVLRGEKFEYYLVQDRGVVINAQGEVDQATLNRDLSARLPESRIVPQTTLSDRLTITQPLTDVSAAESIGISVGSNRDYRIISGNNEQTSGGEINRLRFEAAKMEFQNNDFTATDFRLTNDPFSPPELELRAKTANFTQTAPQVSVLTTEKSRIVIDDSFTVPLLTNRFVIDSRPRQPGIVNFGFDGEERGGLYLERSFKLIETEKTNWEITPQYFLQKALFPTAFDFSDEDDGGIFNPSSLGLQTQFTNTFSPRTSLQARLSLNSLDPDDVEDELRTRVALNQQLGNLANPHTFSLQYNFRDRLFNGSLGFQTVYSSIGGIITSPNIALGKTGINLIYQGSIQNINADTDREDLLEPNRDNDRINLTRYQTAASLNKGFLLWQGKALAPTPNQGLRFTPIPVVPFLQLNTGISGVSSFYSNGDNQPSLQANIGIEGQLGHFSRSYLDYTGFSLTYSQGIRGDRSPFLFDRYVDEKTLSLGITQQIYGPIRVGVQTSLNLDDNEEISTDYVLEYSRRTHNITLRYNPVLEIGSINFRINGFNWRGDTRPFVSPVIQGVSQ